jgi:hypothetical protein
LGNAYTCYQKIIDQTGSFLQEWAFSKSSGWMLKIHDRKKALLYLIPLNAGFRISLTIRENERNNFLCDDELINMHDQISSAKKYTEGFALQFDVANQKEYQPVEQFIRKLGALRV